MDKHIGSVHQFFNNTGNYLGSKSTLILRRLLVSEMLGEINGSEIIDIGCGNGIVSIPFLKNNHVTFLDISENMLGKVREDILPGLMKNADFINTPIEELKTEKSFDLILLLGVLAHVRDIKLCALKIGEISRKGGICIIQITDDSKGIAKLLRFYRRAKKLFLKPAFVYNSNVLNKKSIEQIFLKYGFSLIDERRYLPTFPGFRFLKQETRTKFLMKTHKMNFAKKSGPELILKFVKTF
jgi:2-polyprenyl-3-methyl-5-hydroxy-6-metoxy-1,4-benzoquinol methylase